MDVKSLLNEAINMSKWEKIESGIYNFTLEKIEYRLTDKSKRQAIVYNGTVKNSKGLDQVVNVVDIVDTEDAFKFGAARLVQFINHFGGDVENANSIEELVDRANKYIGKIIKLEFVKKLVNGLTIKEKVFVFNR